MPNRIVCIHGITPKNCCRECSRKAIINWQRDNPEKYKEKHKKWRLNNPKRNKEIHRKADIKYTNLHPDKIKETNNKYYKNNKVKIIKSVSQWAKANPDKCKR